MKTTIIIDDQDRAESGLGAWTANIQDEDGELLADPGFGASRHEALAELLANVSREFPNFAEKDTDDVPPSEQATARIRASLDICDECGNDISGTSYAVSNRHALSCSLHTDNVYPRQTTSSNNTP